MTVSVTIASFALGIWLYLIFAHGAFWLGRECDDEDPPALPKGHRWPSVVAVVPARNEADMLPRSLASLLAQDYPGSLSLLIVDDQSDDGTAAVAGSMASGASRELVVVQGRPLPAGWTGKVWAMQQGVAHAEMLGKRPDYLLLTDADIEYAPEALRRLVVRAEGMGLVLTSLLAKLNCESLAERALIPPFVFFFQMLYPFGWVNRSTRAMAAAAGGCMLVERLALQKAGGIAAIRAALIDDCALARLMKAEGPIWLGLTDRVCSLRPYPRVRDIRHMVARSAYAQLRFSPWLLFGTLVGMGATYFAAPILAIFGRDPANAIAALAWVLMMLAFQPTLRRYRLSPFWAATLSLAAVAYLVFTLDSAYQHWQGRGGAWKGRVQAVPVKR